MSLKKTVKDAKLLFNQFPFTHFPVVDNNKLLGSFAEDDIHTTENDTDELLNYYHFLHFFSAKESDNVLELLQIFANNDTNIIPVLDKDNNYLGYYDLCDVLDIFTSTPFFADESITITVKKLEKDFSMSEIAQIVEANGAKLLGSFISNKQGDYIEATLTITTDEINEIMHTFRRYNYSVLSTIENDEYLEDLQNRADYLNKYLEL